MLKTVYEIAAPADTFVLQQLQWQWKMTRWQWQKDNHTGDDDCSSEGDDDSGICEKNDDNDNNDDNSNDGSDDNILLRQKHKELGWRFKMITKNNGQRQNNAQTPLDENYNCPAEKITV